MVEHSPKILASEKKPPGFMINKEKYLLFICQLLHSIACRGKDPAFCFVVYGEGRNYSSTKRVVCSQSAPDFRLGGF